LVALYAGTHGIANHLDAVLDGAAVLKARSRCDIKLVLVGSGREKQELMLRCQRENLDNVIFHDPMKKGDLALAMAGADVGMQILANVEAFYYGTSPNKFFDYLAAGLPVLTNYPGWIAGLIKESECGFPIPPESPEAFADALEQAADDRARLSSMGGRARMLAESRFPRDELANQLVDVLEDVIQA
jgi:glycosyltransferase involved in cell wall biosynthesis